MSTDKFLVTGAGGFIGSHVAQALLTAGHTVRTIDNFSTGSRGNLESIRGDVELVEGDIRSYERTYTATRGVDVVIHLAALPSVPRSIQDPLKLGYEPQVSLEEGLGYTLEWLQAATWRT